MIRAKYIMRRRAAVKPQTSAKDVISTFSATGLPGVAVINDQMEVVGVITEFDILGALREGMKLEEFTAERVMTKDPVTADPDITASELIKMMLVDNFTVVPIVQNKKFHGVVSRLAILDSYISPIYDVFQEKK